MTIDAEEVRIGVPDVLIELPETEHLASFTMTTTLGPLVNPDAYRIYFAIFLSVVCLGVGVGSDVVHTTVLGPIRHWYSWYVSRVWQPLYQLGLAAFLLCCEHGSCFVSALYTLDPCDAVMKLHSIFQHVWYATP